MFRSIRRRAAFGDGALRCRSSWAMSRERFGKRLGSVRNATLLDVLKRCRLLLRDPG